MTKNEFIELIKNGSDIMFDVGGRSFSIFTWMPQGICIGEQYPYHNAPMQHYRSAEELVEQFIVNRVVIGNLVTGIRITQYS